MSKPRIAIIYYSMYGHVRKLAGAQLAGIREAGGDATLLQVPETLPAEVLAKMHAPPKDANVPVLENVQDLLKYDGFLLGIPTRFGNFPAQWKTVIDSMGQIWLSQGLRSRFCGLFFSTATLGGGQESTAIAAMSSLAHQGIVYVPFGYARLADQTLLDEVHGGSPWGAGTFAGADGSRQPTELELKLAQAQGLEFYKLLSRVKFEGA